MNIKFLRSVGLSILIDSGFVRQVCWGHGTDQANGDVRSSCLTEDDGMTLSSRCGLCWWSLASWAWCAAFEGTGRYDGADCAPVQALRLSGNMKDSRHGVWLSRLSVFVILRESQRWLVFYVNIIRP
jgi:hypothetical protein